MPETDKTKKLVVATQKAVRIRIVVIPIFIALLFFTHIVPEIMLVYLIILLFLLTLALYYSAKIKRGMLALGYISATVEIIIAAYLLRQAGVENYLFFSVFTVLILAHTILENAKKGIYLCTIVVITYISFSLYDKLVIADTFNTMDLLVIFVNTVSFFVIAVLAGKLSDDLKKLNEKLKLSAEVIIDNVGDGLIVFSKDDHVIRKNKVAEQMLETDPGVLKLVKSNQAKIQIGPNIIYESRINYIQDEKVVVLRDVSPAWGMMLTVVDEKNKKPISMVVVRIFKKELNKLQETQVTDDIGRFNFVPLPGEYYITAEKEGYNTYRSPTFTVTKGGAISKFNIELYHR
ncbi:MAG TPA: carboxypeptidase-like regulatory domain-containing protein [Patescibacteria group bacterium]|nr:carboxypeptidase-like regulatory domain-containing protein [Patescibacteria group bacterium]